MTMAALTAFAIAVNGAIVLVDARGRFGERKVFVSAIWDRLCTSQRDDLTLAEFKRCLFMAHRAQLLTLARADLVAPMEPELVAPREIEPDRAVTFHFV